MRVPRSRRWQAVLASILVVVITGIVAITVGLNRSTPQSVREIASLAQVLKTKDPVLHQTAQRTQFDQLASTLEAKARRDPGAPYWLVWGWLNQLTLYLKSPHTFVFFSSDSRGVYPLAFTWSADGLSVSSFPAGRALFPPYSQVVRLGGITPEEVLSRLKSVMAGNSYWVRSWGSSVYLSFPYMLHWIGVLGSSGTLRLTVKEPSGQVETLTVPPSVMPDSRSGLQWLAGQFGLEGAHSPPTWYIDSQHGYGVFHIYTMTLNDALTSDLRDFFTTVEKDGLHRVLFDVRENSGGTTCVTNAVLAYLPNPQGITECGPVPEPAAGLVFRGSVFVAQDWGTFSSAVDFSAGLSLLPEVTVVGEPTGGSPSGDFSVALFKIADSVPVLLGQVGTRQVCLPWLPVTSRPQPAPIRGGCPLVPTFNPKVFIPTTLADLRDHIDPVIQWLNGRR
ncbi:MAG: S41 family peptidase [Candidatus Dormibacteria bacterium]